MFDRNESLRRHYTRVVDLARQASPARGTVATAKTKKILCEIMDADIWTAIELAAKAPMDSDAAAAWREKAGYMLDAPDILL